MRIAPDQGPRVLRLHDGEVTITVRPSNSVLRTAARAKAQAAITRLKDGGAVMEDYGFSDRDFDLLHNEYIMVGFSQMMYAVELGVLLITDWAGYENEKGQPLPPPDREKIIAVMKQDAENFLTAEAAQADRVAREGNALPPSRTGTGAAAANTAKGAGRKTRTARKAGAG